MGGPYPICAVILFAVVTSMRSFVCAQRTVVLFVQCRTCAMVFVDVPCHG